MTLLANKLNACFNSSIVLGLLIVAILVPLNLKAQSSTAQPDTLAEIKVTASKYTVDAIYQPIQLLLIDEKTLRLTGAQDLSTLLSLVGYSHIRSYGPGLAAGITQRGFTTSSFQIIREGFVLNNPMYGQVDMALIPLDLLSSAEGASANASSAYGSAALGGSLVLNSNWNPELSFTHTVGSFGFNQTSVFAGEQYGNTRLILQAGRKAAENNFSFINPENVTRERRSNNAQNSQWLRFGSISRLGKYQLQTNLTALKAEREIPDAIIFSPAQALQKDSEFRLATMLLPMNSNPWSVNLEINQSNISYNDIYLSTPSKNLVQSASISSSIQMLSSPIVNARMDNGLSFISTNSNNFDDIKSRNMLNSSIYGSVKAGDKLLIFPSIRFDWISDVDYALSYSTGLNLPIIPQILHLRSQVSRNFTVPTLNDLYWAYGGNPDLLPEKSLKADLGYHFNIKGDRFQLEWQVQAFRAELNNGIVWRPKDLYQWSPVNIQQIVSSGFEQNIRWTADIGPLNTELRAQVSYTKAEVSRSRFDGDNAVGKQLPYTPKWLFRFQPSLTYKKTELSFGLTHDGKRYISEDHSNIQDPFDSYTLINSTLLQSIEIGKIDTILKLGIINLFDKKYNAINGYPLPGRSINLGIKIKV